MLFELGQDSQVNELKKYSYKMYIIINLLKI